MYSKNKIAATLAIAAMLGFLTMFAVLGFAPVPPENKDFFNMGFIALIGFTSTAFGYYLGSSMGSAQKNDLLARSTPGLSPGGEGLSDAGFVRLPLLFLLTAFACIIALTGCATTTPTAATSTVATVKDNPMALAGKSLLAVKTTIVVAATSVDALCQAGTIGTDKCAQAKAAYDLAKPAYDSAVDAYLLMSQGYGDPVAFGTALARVQGIADNLLILSGPMGPKGGAQ